MIENSGTYDRCRTASASYKERSKKIHKEIAKASEIRLMKEVDRAKLLVEEPTIDKPRPASFYISKARNRFITKNSPKSSSVSRSTHFGPLLATQIFQKGGTLRPSRGKQRNSISIVSENAKVIPDWLLERQDFQVTAKKLLHGESNIGNICGIAPSARTDEEKSLLFRWVSSTTFFSKVPSRVTKETCEKLTRHVYNPKEMIIKKGDIGDCLYIIYSGSAELFLDFGNSHGILCSKQVIGEHALDTLKPRTGTIIAIDEVIAFRLTKLDYDSILLNVKKMEKYKNSKLLVKIPFFRAWSYLKVQHLSNHLIAKQFNKGDVIHDKGDESDTFYLIKSGQVEIQAYVELQHINRWPTGGHEWKILEINRKYIVPVITLKKGTYFGESSLIEQLPRVCRAICKTDVTCLVLGRDEFFEIFSIKDLEGILENQFVKIPQEAELQKNLIDEIKNTSMTVNFI